MYLCLEVSDGDPKIGQISDMIYESDKLEFSLQLVETIWVSHFHAYEILQQQEQVSINFEQLAYISPMETYVYGKYISSRFALL